MESSWQSISLDSTSWRIWVRGGPHEGGQLVLLRPYPRTLGLSSIDRVKWKRHLQTALQIKGVSNSNQQP